jgi:hypothetical protein
MVVSCFAVQNVSLTQPKIPQRRLFPSPCRHICAPISRTSCCPSCCFNTGTVVANVIVSLAKRSCLQCCSAQDFAQRSSIIAMRTCIPTIHSVVVRKCFQGTVNLLVTSRFCGCKYIELHPLCSFTRRTSSAVCPPGPPCQT